MNVQWIPSPNFGSTARGVPGRLAIGIRAEVKHRIVGSLQSCINVFMDPNRQASTHFGIGTLNGVTSVVQFVNLSDMAWGNGDVRDPTWTRYRAGENPNLSTVSTEHEDGGAANNGVISEATWQASMELSRLLRSGDVNAIRAAGIRVRDPVTVAQLAAMPIDTGSYIDHHQIAGPNKPYCLRRWLDDPGFVEGSPSRRDRLLAALRAPQEADMPTPVLTYVPQLWTANAGGAELREQASLAAPAIDSIPAGTAIFTLGEASSGPRWRVAVAGDPERLLFVRRDQITAMPPTPRDQALYDGIAAVVNARAVGQPAPTGLSAEELANIQKAAREGGQIDGRARAAKAAAEAPLA